MEFVQPGRKVEDSEALFMESEVSELEHPTKPKSVLGVANSSSPVTLSPLSKKTTVESIGGLSVLQTEAEVAASSVKKVVPERKKAETANVVPGEASDANQGAFVDESGDVFPPKVDSEIVMLTKGVGKQVIKEGHGRGPPSRHSSCFVHYRAWTASTMHKFDDTWAEQQPQELRLGHEKKVLKGLAIGVGSMKIGERALLQVSHTLAYGEEGSFSFPNVPPAADVLYEVELIGYEEACEGRPPGEMVVEERIEAADRRKVDGNELFKEGKIAEAMQQYEMALAYMGDDFMFQLFGKYHDMAIAVKNPCHLNLAACMLKIHRFEEAIGHCSVVLAEDPKNTKALFRRGKARAELGQTDAAKEDFDEARKLEPDNKEVIRELRVIAKQERELYDKQREMYKGLFKPSPSATTQNSSTVHWYSRLWQKWVAPVLHYLFKFQRSKRE